MRFTGILCILIIFFCELSFAQQNPETKGKVKYDSLLAKQIGADEYGMKTYVMAFLKSGPVKIQDSLQRAVLLRKHLKNIRRLAAEGTLIVAGPFLDNQTIRGVFIFNVESIQEAQKIAETDPAVKAGVFVLELHPWYGSAALVETAKIHNTLEKKSVAD
jgi:uncharacterized protein YciI